MGFRGGSGGTDAFDGASSIDNARLEVGTLIGPANYLVGGFTFDLSARFDSLSALHLTLQARGALPPGVTPIVTLDTPLAGQARIMLSRASYDRVSSVDAVINQPVGVTVQAASGAQVALEGAHQHLPGTLGIPNHDVQGDPDTAIGGPAVPVVGHGAISGATAVGSPHQHVDNNIYEHDHTATQAQSNLIATEPAGGTNFATTEWRYLAIGQGL